MSRLLSILLSAFLFLGIAPIANARPGPALNADRAPTDFTASALVTCSENARFQERASAASTDQAVKRFERYGKALCGDDGLPHLIIVHLLNLGVHGLTEVMKETYLFLE